MSRPLLMSFRADAIELCLSGKKTQTRRLLKDSSWLADGGLCWRSETRVGLKRKRLSAVEAYVWIESVKIEPLYDLTDEDAIAECVEPPTRAGYFSVWRQLHPNLCITDPEVVVITFRPLN